MGTCTWPIGNGQGLSFKVHTQEANWKQVPGLYIFARSAHGAWDPLYVGQTEDFCTRIPDHERWDEAARLGAVYVHAVVIRDAETRNRLEEALIRYLNPPLNTQLRRI